MSYNTNIKIPMSKTASLSDAHAMARKHGGKLETILLIIFLAKANMKNLKS